jgi:hypothetical protein
MSDNVYYFQHLEVFLWAEWLQILDEEGWSNPKLGLRYRKLGNLGLTTRLDIHSQDKPQFNDEEINQMARRKTYDEDINNCLDSNSLMWSSYVIQHQFS